MPQNPNDVSYRSRAYLDMERLWRLPDDLLGGTLRMRDQAATYLPQREGEELGDWLARVNGAVLFEGYGKALDEITSRPFERPVSVQGADGLGEFLSQLEDDVDGTGRSLSSFAREVLREGLHRGLTHVLVDVAQVAPGATLADVRGRGVRPNLIHVQPPRLLGWRWTVVEGRRVLDMIRVYERSTEPDGLYGEVDVERVRVYTREGWEVWTRTTSASTTLAEASASGPPVSPGPGRDPVSVAGGEFVRESAGTHAFGAVPLVTFYFDRVDEMVGRPVFEGVAHLNLAHFRSDSRQRAYLDFARIGVLARFGVKSKEDGSDVVAWGANQTLDFEGTPQQSDAKILEHEGKAVEAGRNDLQDLKADMEAMALAPLVQRATAITATGEARDEDRGMSKAQGWVRELEQGLVRCYELGGKWVREDLPEDFGVDVFSDFGITQRSTDEAKMLLEAHAAGQITSQTLLREWKRRGVFSDQFDPDVEVEEVEAEKRRAVEMARAMLPDVEGDEEDPEEGADDGVPPPPDSEEGDE